MSQRNVHVAAAYDDIDTDDVRIPFLRHWRGILEHFDDADMRQTAGPAVCDELGIAYHGPPVQWTQLADRVREQNRQPPGAGRDPLRVAWNMRGPRKMMKGRGTRRRRAKVTT